jgi:hypothetical protein
LLNINSGWQNFYPLTQIIEHFHICKADRGRPVAAALATKPRGGEGASHELRAQGRRVGTAEYWRQHLLFFRYDVTFTQYTNARAAAKPPRQRRRLRKPVDSE